MTTKPKKDYSAHWFVFALIATACIIWAASSHEVTTAQTIPCDHQQISSPYLASGQTKVLQFCANGNRKVVTSYNNLTGGYRGQVSTVTMQPTPEIIEIGTGTTTTQTEHGSICNDGWQSQSVGRGTCSYHGGVRYSY